MMDFDALKRELVEDEGGVQLHPYRCSAGKLTIGVGRNLDDNGIRHSEALLMLSNDIEDAYLSAKSIVGGLIFMRLNPVRQQILVNMCFQLGPAGFKGFQKMLEALRNEDYEEAAKQILDSRAAKQCPSRFERHAQRMKEGN